MVTEHKDELPSVRSIFLEVIDRYPGKDYSAFLNEACGDDKELRKAVENLLEAHRAADPGFLDPPDVTDVKDTVVLRERCFPPEYFERQRPKPGDVIDAYEIIDQIGEGGFAIVYEAQQKRPVNRRVALKLLKPGMDSEQIMARFETERQALALMHHPGIAHVYDAGATEIGHPYFVMELVDGDAITRYCDEKNLTIPERLRLFVQVCRAIQHAHQKAVIHRDIKPTNILVVEVDGKPVPMVIDFGIAKAVGEDISSGLTREGQFLGTPQYMSPEQAGLNNWDVDTRSDIYSLGVVLYELVTGGTPLLAKDLTDAGYAAMEHLICEETAPRPTARLAACDDDTEMIAKKRGAEPAKLRRQIRGDVDWIILKALEKDRNLRYETVNALADDIERHLRNEPVEASPHSIVYRVRYFVLRNKAAVAIAAALVAGIIGSTWQAVVAERARSDAEVARELSDEARLRAEAVAAFLESTLRSPAPSQTDIGRSITVAEMLDGAMVSLNEDRELDVATKIRLFSALGDAYAGRGKWIGAVDALRKAYLLSEAVHGAASVEILPHMVLLAKAERRSGNYERAIELGEVIVEEYREREGSLGEETLQAMQELADSYSARGRHEDATALIAEAVEGCRRTYGDTGLKTMDALDREAQINRKAGAIDVAIAILEKSIRLLREHYAADEPRLMFFMGRLVTYYSNARRHDDAIALAGDNVDLRLRNRGDTHVLTFNALHTLAAVKRAAGRIDEAIHGHEKVLALRREHLGRSHPDIFYSMDSLAGAYHAAQRMDDALELAIECLEFREELLSDDHYLARTSVSTLANVLMSAGEKEKAIDLYEESLELRRNAVGTNDPGTLVTMDNLAIAYRKAGRIDDSIELHREALDIQIEIYGIEGEESIDTLANLAASLRIARQFDAAIVCYEQALFLRRMCSGTKGIEISKLESSLADTRRNAGMVSEPGDHDGLTDKN